MTAPIIVIGPSGGGKTTFMRYLSRIPDFVPSKNGRGRTNKIQPCRLEFDGVEDDFLLYDSFGSTRNNASKNEGDVEATITKIFNDLPDKKIKALIVVLPYNERNYGPITNYTKTLIHSLKSTVRMRIFFVLTSCSDNPADEYYFNTLSELIPNLRLFPHWRATEVPAFELPDNPLFKDNEKYTAQLTAHDSYAHHYDSVRNVYVYQDAAGNEIGDNVVSENIRNFMLKHRRVSEWYRELKGRLEELEGGEGEGSKLISADNTFSDAWSSFWKWLNY